MPPRVPDDPRQRSSGLTLTWRSFDTRFTLAQVPRPEDLTEAQRVSFAMGVKLKVEKKFASLDALRPAKKKKKKSSKTRKKKKELSEEKEDL